MLSDRKGEVLEEGDLPGNFGLPGDSGNTLNAWTLAVLSSGITNADRAVDLDGEKGGVGVKVASGDRGVGGTASARRLYPKPDGCISSEADFTVEARGSDVIKRD